MPWSLLICEERSAGLPCRRPGVRPGPRVCGPRIAARRRRASPALQGISRGERFKALADSRYNESCALRIFLAETVPTLSTPGTGRAHRRFYQAAHPAGDPAAGNVTWVKCRRRGQRVCSVRCLARRRVRAWPSACSCTSEWFHVNHIRVKTPVQLSSASVKTPK